MRRLWPHRVLGGDPLPPVQVGLEECAPRERDGAYAEAGQASSFGALIGRLNVRRTRSLPNIFIPQVWVRADKVAHHANALRIVENDDAHSVLAEEVLSPLEVSILSNDDAGDTKQQGRASAHDAGTQSADECQFGPIPTSAGVTKAHGFCMGCRVAALDSQVVSAGNDLPLPGGQNRTDRQSSLAQALLRLLESLLQ